jgi:hypothetical protein
MRDDIDDDIPQAFFVPENRKPEDPALGAELHRILEGSAHGHRAVI